MAITKTQIEVLSTTDASDINNIESESTTGSEAYSDYAAAEAVNRSTGV